MNELEKLAIQHIKNLAENLDNDLHGLNINLMDEKFTYDAQKHLYPIMKGSEIRRWADALLNYKTK